jgi:AraC-like DNA-binding protein
MRGEVLISTSAVEPKLRSEFWREVTRPVYITSPFDDDDKGELEGSVRSRSFGTMMIVESSFNRQQYVRDRQLIQRSGMSDYILHVVTSGTVVGDFPQTSLKAKPGDIFIVDLAYPLHTRAEAGSRVSVAIPREPLERAIGRRNLHGFVLQSHWAITQILTDYLLGLNAAAGDISTDESEAIREALLILLSGAVAGREIPSSPCPPELYGVLRKRILEYIDQHIADADLGPQKLMARFRVSRTHLYRTFEADGGVATLIREKRLDLAYQHLAALSAKGDGESIKTLCFRYGFSSPENFNRVFKDRFGMTPKSLKTSEVQSRLLETDGHDLHGYFKKFLPRK